MQTAIRGTLMLFPFTLCLTSSLAATPFTIEAESQRLGPGHSATLTASGTNGAIPGWNVIAGGCTVPASGNPVTVTPPAGNGTHHCEIEGYITASGGRSSVSKTFDWSSFSISAVPDRATPHQLISLTTQPASNVNWSISGPASHSRSLPGLGTELRTPLEPSSCQQEVWTFRGQNPGDASDYSEANVTVNCPLGMTWHSVVGIEQGQASGSNRIFRLFVDLGVNFPFPYRHHSQVGDRDDFYGRRLRFWSNFRLTSAPRQFDTALSNAIPAIDSAIKNVTLSDVAQAMELLGGLEYRLAETADAHFSIGATRERFAFHAIAAAGLTTAFDNGTPITLYSDIRMPMSSPQYYAVIRPTDSSTYPGQYYGGLRWKTFYFDDHDHLLNIAPTTIEILFGHDAVGSRPGLIPTIRVDGFFSFPSQKFNFMHFFVTVIAKLDHPPSDIDPRLSPFLQSIAFDPAVLASARILTTQGVNRDFYRFGGAIDIWKLLEKVKAIDPRPAGL
jgi:hypothetical protein